MLWFQKFFAYGGDHSMPSPTMPAYHPFNSTTTSDRGSTVTVASSLPARPGRLALPPRHGAIADGPQTSRRLDL